MSADLPARVTDIWVYLSAGPLLWLTLTLLAYALADFIAFKAGRNPLASPVAMSTAILVTLLVATGTSYETYFAGAQFIHFLLGPATVALAVPLYRNLPRVRAALLPMGAALLAGSVTAIVLAVLIAGVLGAPRDILASLAPKSVTTPIAMSLAEALGGIPTLAAVLVLITGIFGGSVVTPLMNSLGITDPQARGFAAGLAAHGIGTARAFQVNSVAGAFAGIAMSLNGALTAMILPLLAHMWGP